MSYKYQPMEATGELWCSRRNKKKARGSQTPGKEKPFCVAGPLDRYLARRSRSYKHRDYPRWCRKMNGRNKVATSSK